MINQFITFKRSSQMLAYVAFDIIQLSIFCRICLKLHFSSLILITILNWFFLYTSNIHSKTNENSYFSGSILNIKTYIIMAYKDDLHTCIAMPRDSIPWLHLNLVRPVHEPAGMASNGHILWCISEAASLVQEAFFELSACFLCLIFAAQPVCI